MVPWKIWNVISISFPYHSATNFMSEWILSSVIVPVNHSLSEPSVQHLNV